MFQNLLDRLFGGNNADNGLEALQSLLSEREATLSLTARYGRPTVNTTGEPTAVFPITLYNEGEEYGAHSKEFAIPDDGLEDTDSPLAKFLDKHDIHTVEELGNIEGVEDTAALNDNGDVEVGV